MKKTVVEGGGIPEGQDGGNAVWVPGPAAGDSVCSEDRTWTGGDSAVTRGRAKERGQFGRRGALEEAVVSMTSHHLKNGK